MLKSENLSTQLLLLDLKMAPPAKHPRLFYNRMEAVRLCCESDPDPLCIVESDEDMS